MSIRTLGGVYRLHVSLDDIEPPIWRRVLVRSDATLSALHEILQLAMGWTNSHLYLFQQAGVDYGEANPEWDVEDAGSIAVHALLRRPGDTITYLYDMGDEWRHTVRLESVIRDEEPETRLPWCEAGEGACPPEDSGGARRFMTMLAALPDPSHPDHRMWKEWIGSFDRDAFSVALVNRLFATFTRRAERRSGMSGNGVDRPHRGPRLVPDDEDDDYVPSRAAGAIIEAAHRQMKYDRSFFKPSAFERVGELVAIYDATNPGVLERSRKLGTWAAGAIHAAILTLPEYDDVTVDMQSLASAFDISAGSVQQKSKALRDRMEWFVERLRATGE